MSDNEPSQFIQALFVTRCFVSVGESIDHC